MVLLESQVKLKAGDSAPEFELLGIDDKKHQLSEFKGKEGILIECSFIKLSFLLAI